MLDFHKVDQYKNEIDRHRPFEGHLLKELQDYYRVDLTYTSNALEGNTLTISETKIVLEDGLTVAGKPLKDYYEATGHAKAYDHMFSLIKSHSISEADIKELHKLFYYSIAPDGAGVYRSQQVFVTGSQYPVSTPDAMQQDMDGLMRWVSDKRESYHPVEFAAQLHKRFVFIHPFIDGNGRVARLLMNLSLMQDGYLLAIVPPVLRNEYIASLEQARKNDVPFTGFIRDRVLETEKDYARLLGIPLIREKKETPLNERIAHAKGKNEERNAQTQSMEEFTDRER